MCLDFPILAHQVISFFFENRYSGIINCIVCQVFRQIYLKEVFSTVLFVFFWFTVWLSNIFFHTPTSFQQSTAKFDDMTTSLIHMANHLDASTEEVSLNYVLLGRPHRDKTLSHPSYMEMIKGAIQATNNGKGSSKAAILKFIAQNYHVGENLPKVRDEGIYSGRFSLGETRQKQLRFQQSPQLLFCLLGVWNREV